MNKLSKKLLAKKMAGYCAAGIMMACGSVAVTAYLPVSAEAAAFEANGTNYEVVPTADEKLMTVDAALIKKAEGASCNAVKFLFTNVDKKSPLSINVTGDMAKTKLIIGSNDSHIDTINVAAGKTLTLNVSKSSNNAYINQLKLGNGAKLSAYTVGSSEDKPVTTINTIVLGQGASIETLLVFNSVEIQCDAADEQAAKQVIAKVELAGDATKTITVKNAQGKTFVFNAARNIVK